MKNITQNNSKQNYLISKIKQFFSTNGWEPLHYQIDSWEAFLNGDSGIIQVPTGCGKTYAALMGPLSQIEDPNNNKSVQILLITPLKALSRDLKNSVQLAALHFNKEITVEIRNGDTTSYEKKKQLIKFASAYSGLTNIEIKELDKCIRKNTIAKFGPVRSLKPEMVFEISFEKIQISKRHKSGIAVRFPRITKWRKDKNINDANSIENAYELMKKIS